MYYNIKKKNQDNNNENINNNNDKKSCNNKNKRCVFTIKTTLVNFKTLHAAK